MAISVGKWLSSMNPASNADAMARIMLLAWLRAQLRLLPGAVSPCTERSIRERVARIDASHAAVLKSGRAPNWKFRHFNVSFPGGSKRSSFSMVSASTYFHILLGWRFA